MKTGLLWTILSVVYLGTLPIYVQSRPIISKTDIRLLNDIPEFGPINGLKPAALEDSKFSCNELLSSFD
jgi:hypothetical protein